MRSNILLQTLSLASLCCAQSDLASVLQSQPDLSTLLDLVILANLTDTLSAASNITIVAPTNDAFAELARFDTPEAVAVRNRDAVTVEALLRNHVFQGYYPASAIGKVPTFVQSLVMPSEQNTIQPFTANTGGQYNGLVKNGQNVDILSSEFTVSRVTQADIRIGDGIIVHKIDEVLSFGTPLKLFTARYGYTDFNAAYEASNLSLFSGIEITSASESPATDVTVFIPIDQAFEAIGSILSTADQSTLQEVLKYHVIKDNIIFSPSITNTTVPSVQGGDLTFSVAEDGAVYVNNAKVILPNLILYEGVAHIIDSVLNPLVPFDRADLEANTPRSDRVQFEGATSTSKLPFTSITFASETTFAFSVDPVFSTAFPNSVAANPTSTVAAAISASPSASQYTGAAMRLGASHVIEAAAVVVAAAGLANFV